MALPAPSRPFVLLNNMVRYQQYYHCRMVECECERWVAYGCGPLGQQIVEGLTFLADTHGGNDAAPRLTVHTMDEVLHRLEEEVPGELARINGSVEEADRMVERYGTKVVPSAEIEAVDDEGGVLVLRLIFIHHSHSEHLGLLSYHVIYDRDAASLTLLPYEPTNCRAVYTSRPLLVGRHGGGGGYSLALTAVDALGQPVVGLWTPSLGDDDDGDAGLGPWRTRQRRHATAVPDTFDAALVFTYKGKAFWADLTQGILYCDCADLLDDDARSLEFTFVALPEEYMTEEEDFEYKHRTMGVGVGDSVWFVVLKSCNHPGDCTVVVLNLDLSDGAGRQRWERHMELSLLTIWTLEGFVEAGVPRRVPCSPFLREQDAGVIYLLVPPANVNSEGGCHLIGIDVRDDSKPRLLQPRHLAVVPIFPDQPALLSPEFFDRRLNHEGALSLT